MDQSTLLTQLLKTAIDTMRGTLPTMEDALNDALIVAKDLNSAGWQAVADAYQKQIDDIKDVISLCETSVGEAPETHGKVNTVSELIIELLQLDLHRKVVVSKDSEGNAYSPLAGLYVGNYVPDSTWSGSVNPELDDDLVAQGIVPEGASCVVLVPTN